MYAGYSGSKLGEAFAAVPFYGGGIGAESWRILNRSPVVGCRTVYTWICKHNGKSEFIGVIMKMILKPINRKLEHNLKSYSIVFVIGILVGCICRLLDYFPLDTLWGFSSIQTLLGFWIITNTMIVLLSSSNICAGISSFLYMFGMTTSFYGLQAILGTFIPLFSGGFRFSLFVRFTILSIPCGVAAFILYYWNKDSVFNSILYSLPVGALIAEVIAVFAHFLECNTLLFQLLMDVVGAIVFGIIFFKKAKSKKIYVMSTIISSLIFYFIFPW